VQVGLSQIWLRCLKLDKRYQKLECCPRF
jgi:hypothetical protein